MYGSAECNRLQKLIIAVVFTLSLSACQTGAEEATFVPVSSITAITLNQARTLIPPPTAATVTPLFTPPSTSQVGVGETSLAATPVRPPTPGATATPVPEPTTYLVQPGDTLISIAEQYDVSTEALLYANGAESLDEFVLFAGSEIQIPLCEAHSIMPGNTLSGIAALCGVSLDELITENLDVLAPYGTLESLTTGLVLLIPRVEEVTSNVDCEPQPPREQVIEYLPKTGEGIVCLSQKFGVSTTTIVQANIDRLSGDKAYGEEYLLIPPFSGALYTVTAEDIEAGITLLDLAEWYEVSPEAIVDWNGNRIAGSLMAGQQLYLPGSNLAFGSFQAGSAPPTETPPG
jgi:LysM repeat protein